MDALARPGDALLPRRCAVVARAELPAWSRSLTRSNEQMGRDYEEATSPSLTRTEVVHSRCGPVKGEQVVHSPTASYSLASASYSIAR
eukprot:366029-Chlamydomonas_euryale.AAC.33